MEYQATLELLEATHEFPGPYLFKVVGRAEHQFEGRVLAAFRSRLPEQFEPAFSVRRTPHGRHLCVTIEAPFESARDVIDMYEQLRTVAGVMMLF